MTAVRQNYGQKVLVQVRKMVEDKLFVANCMIPTFSKNWFGFTV
jgi:hypothetical protein